MTDESLSALLDGECTPAEVDRLLAEMESHPEMKARFSRLCLARESRHGSRIRAADLEFAGRVMAALEGTPAGKVLAFPARWSNRRVPAWRPLAGFAAAAAIAAIAVLAVRPEATPMPATSAQASLAVSQSLPGPLPDAESEAQLLPTSYRPWTQLDADNMRQLNTYFMTYSNSRAEHGMGALGYARYAANPAEERAPQQVQENTP